MAQLCPRCLLPLAAADIRELQLQGCRRCGGVWLDPQGLGTILRAMHTDALNAADRGAAQAAGFVDRAPVAACPECGAPMERLTMANGQVEVDRCREHGTWFDAGELRHVADAQQTNLRGHPGPRDTALGEGAALAGSAALAAGAGLAMGSVGGDGRSRRSAAVEGALEGAVEVADGALIAIDIAETPGVAEAASEAASASADAASGAGEVVTGALEASLEIIGGIFGALG